MNKLDAATYFSKLREGKRNETLKFIRDFLEPMKKAMEKRTQGETTTINTMSEIRMLPYLAKIKCKDEDMAREIERETREILGYFLDLDTITFTYTEEKVLIMRMWDTKMLFLDTILKKHY